ncbi:MAG TPA: ribokinase [Terriglobia bacterium]|nr:ribokinase [Terriglobia bacterium]
MKPVEDVRVVVVGSNNFDMVVNADRLPREGENLLATNLKFFPGGKGANQAVAVARLGAKATFIGAVGKDIIGDFLVGHLEASGIDTRWVRRDPTRSTGCAFIAIYPNGNNSIIVDPAANYTLTPADIERAQESIEEADAVLTVLEIPIETVEAVLRAGRKAGKLTVLDAGPPRKCSPEILKLADIVSPNETELEALSKEKVSGRESVKTAASKLLDMGVETVVVKMGSDGSMLVTRKGATHFPASKVKAVDPTAAGDAFTAALTVRLAMGEKIEDAIRYANLAGALAVTKLGALPSLPTREEVEAFAAGAKFAPDQG